MNRVRSDASPFARHPYWKAYTNQRYQALRRGIAFQLEFKQWLSIWKASGHLPNRGKQKGQYVMARHGDCGPYANGNVKIVTINQNGHESKGKTGQTTPIECREKISLSHRKLSPLTEAQVREIRRSYVPYSRDANTVALAREYGVAQATVWTIIANRSWKPQAARR
jgi:hypothetical protein